MHAELSKQPCYNKDTSEKAQSMRKNVLQDAVAITIEALTAGTGHALYVMLAA